MTEEETDSAKRTGEQDLRRKFQAWSANMRAITRHPFAVFKINRR
jgi:hypothetical protein